MTALSVIGSRGFPHLEEVVPYGIDSQLGSCDTLISGGARGVDFTAVVKPSSYAHTVKAPPKEPPVQVDGDLKQRLGAARCPRCDAEGAFALVGHDFPHFGRVICGASVGPLLEALRDDGHFIDWLQAPKEIAKARRRTRTHRVTDLTERCELCLRQAGELHPPATLTAHHVIEVQHDGEATDENRRVYCTDCQQLVHWLRRTHGRPQAT